MASSGWRSSVRPIGAVLMLAAGAVASGPAFAQQSGRCNAERIVAEIDRTHVVPSLRRCRPEAVRGALRSRDYGLDIGNRHPSHSVPARGVVSQRVESHTHYVAVSSGPEDHPELAGQAE